MKRKHIMSFLTALCIGAVSVGCGSGNAVADSNEAVQEESTEQKEVASEDAEAAGDSENVETAEVSQDTEDAENEAASEDAAESAIEEEEVAKSAAPTSFELGATVYASEESPTGYMVHFAYEKDKDDENPVSVCGPFLYLDPEVESTDESNCYTPYEYQNGFYPSNMAPGTVTWSYVEELKLNEESGYYEAEFPISSGSFAYSYLVKDEKGEDVMIEDPANPSPAKDNANSDFATGDLSHSIVYGVYDPEKQSKSVNMDYVRPSESNAGKQIYVEYEGKLSDHQDLGIYTPASYDPEREEPYKVIYMSHGGGGNETDWFAMGHVDNIIDNLGEDIIVVTMDNSSMEWDFDKIEANVLECIIPYMEENYNVSKEAKDRAFAGLSMGCMTTFHMYYDHPTEFGYFGGFSGPDLSAIKDTEGLQDATLFFTVGTCDIASAKVMPDGEGQQIKYEDYVEYLETSDKGEKVIDGGYIYGAHDWFTWSQSFYRFVTEVAFK